MESGAPLIMILLPPLAALLALALRRWRRAAVAVGLVALLALTVYLLLAAPGTGLLGDNTAALYGRPLTLTPAIRGLFLFLYPALAALFVLHWFRPWGVAVVPVGLVTLAPLAAALLIAPPELGAVLLVAALGLAAPALTNSRREAAAASWRAFLMAVLGLTPLVAVAWLQGSGAAGAGSGAALLLAVLILLGGFPFHIWLRPLASHTSPGALVIAFGLLPIGVAAYLFGLLDATPAVRAAGDFQSAIRLSAALTALTAAFLMLRANTHRDWLTAALLLDGGFLLTAALAPGAAGLAAALVALASRTLSLLLISLALRWPAGEGETMPVWRRLGTLRTALLVYGGLSLVGLPLTPGFAARWGQVSLVAASAGVAGWLAWLAPVALLAALAAGAWSARRLAAAETMDETHPPVGLVERVAALVLLALALLLGLFPGLLTGYAAWLLGA